MKNATFWLVVYFASVLVALVAAIALTRCTGAGSQSVMPSTPDFGNMAPAAPLGTNYATDVPEPTDSPSVSPSPQPSNTATASPSPSASASPTP